MLFHLFKWFQTQGLNFPGINLMDFITVRVMLAVLLPVMAGVAVVSDKDTTRRIGEFFSQTDNTPYAYETPIGK